MPVGNDSDGNAYSVAVSAKPKISTTTVPSRASKNSSVKKKTIATWYSIPKSRWLLAPLPENISTMRVRVLLDFSPFLFTSSEMLVSFHSQYLQAARVRNIYSFFCLPLDGIFAHQADFSSCEGHTHATVPTLRSPVNLQALCFVFSKYCKYSTSNNPFFVSFGVQYSLCVVLFSIFLVKWPLGRSLLALLCFPPYTVPASEMLPCLPTLCCFYAWVQCCLH